jgi:hypothetical protein
MVRLSHALSEGPFVRIDRRRVLKAALGCGAAAAGAAVLRRFGRSFGIGAARSQKPAPLAAHRVLLQAEDSWGLMSTTDQFHAPVTSGWTWLAYDQWQLPRRPSAIIGTGAFLQGGAAATVAPPGRLWQDVEVPAAGTYRLFVRVADFGDGINRIAVACGGAVHQWEWGTTWRTANPAALLRRLRGTHALLAWREAAELTLERGTNRIAIDIERADQSYLILDALYLTNDPTEARPLGWNPLARLEREPMSPVKRRRTVTNPQRIEAARTNVRRFAWASQEADRILDVARQYSNRPDDEIWHLMPSSRIPRADRVAAHGKGCPVHGRRVDEAAVPWRIDPFEHPYQVQCSAGGEWHPARLDPSDEERVRSHALREAGPERWAFIRHYCHEVYLRHVRPAAVALGQAYALTGDRAYAHTAAVLLCRVAQQYPNGEEKRNRAYQPPYSFGSGAIVNSVRSGDDLTAFATAYDFIFDAIEGDSDLVRFVSRKAPGIGSAADVRVAIEEGLLRAMARGVIDGAIRANPGTFEAGLSAVALCLDDFDGGRYPDSYEMIRSLYYDQPAQDSDWSIPKRYLSNLVHPNGCADSSVDYGSLLQSLIDCGTHVEALRRLHPDRFDRERFPDLLRHPRLRRHIDFLTDVVCLGRYHPALGDGHGKALWAGDNLTPMQMPPRLSTLAYPQSLDALFRARPDAALARLILAQTASGVEASPRLFDSPIDADVAAAAGEPHDVRDETMLLDEHGLVMLRAGAGADERVLCLNYRGGVGNHRHADRFALQLFGLGIDLLPELPYLPSYDFVRLNNFERHPLLHNTLTFDRRAEADGPACLVRLVETPNVSGATVRTTANRKSARSVERTCVLVNVDAVRWYVVDVVDASGGAEHHLSFHAANATDVRADGITLRPQTGTMANPAGRYGEATDMAGASGGFHPFCFMSDVATGIAGDAFTVDHRFGDAHDVHLRVWSIVPPQTTVTAATGRPPVDPDAYHVRLMFASRSGPPPLQSRFVQVLEPYRRDGFVKTVEAVRGEDADSVAIRVVLEDRVDTVIINPRGSRTRVGGVETDAYLSHFADRGRGVEALAVAGGTTFDRPPGLRASLRPGSSGRLLSVNRDRDAIVVRRGDLATQAVEGRSVRVYNDLTSRMYRIVAASDAGDGRVQLRLDRSSLLAEGVALGFQDGIVLNRILMPFATPGCTLEPRDGASAWRIVGRDRVGHNGTASGPGR